MFYNTPELTKLIDAKGYVNFADPRFNVAKQVAEGVTKRLIGCTLQVRNKAFVLTSLELYYGGIGDDAQDWYRGWFKIENPENKTKLMAKVQNGKGLGIYLHKFGSRYQRMDLAFGPEGVPVSALIRNAYDIGNKCLLADAEIGGPSTVLASLPILAGDHGQRFGESSEFVFYDTHSKYVKDVSTDILRRKRIVGGKPVGLGGPALVDLEWNFTLRDISTLTLSSKS